MILKHKNKEYTIVDIFIKVHLSVWYFYDKNHFVNTEKSEEGIKVINKLQSMNISEVIDKIKKMNQVDLDKLKKYMKEYIEYKDENKIELIK